MPVVPGFKYDVFISYAHRNDYPWKWVTEFVQTLKAELESKNRDIRIWWDPGLRTGEHFDIAIANAISESAVFLSILSLAYEDSEYCKREIEEFRKQRHPAFGLTVGSMSRVQAIHIERDFTRERWAPEFRTISPQAFFDERSPIFSRPSNLISSDPWIQGLWAVRDSIWAVLQEMRSRVQRGAVVERNYGVAFAPAQHSPTLFLAQVTDDLLRKRERLESALTQVGKFQVRSWDTPDAPAVSDPDMLSVHLFGIFPGRPFGSSELSLSRQQLAACLAAQPARKPLVWLARNLDLDDSDTDEHRAFLQSLLENNAIELLRSDLEDLKDDLIKRMTPSAPPPKATRAFREAPIIHIWHAMNETEQLTPLKRFLTDNNCGISVFDARTAGPEKIQSRLAVCDGLILPFTPETRTWAEDMMTEAFRLRRREERPTAFAAVELPPALDREFNFEHPRVVPVFVQKADFGDVGDFLARLEQENA